MRRLPVVLVLAVLGVLGACGGSGSKDTKSSSPTTTVLTASGFTGKDSKRFCTLARDYSPKIAEVSKNITNPVQAKNVLADLAPAVKEAADAAPDEIKTDVQYLATAFKSILDSLESGRSPDIATLANPQFQVSADKLTRYGREVCGIAP